MPRSISAGAARTLPSRLIVPSRRWPADSYWAGEDPRRGRAAGGRASGPGRRPRRRSCRPAPRPAGHRSSGANGLAGSSSAIRVSAAAPARPGWLATPGLRPGPAGRPRRRATVGRPGRRHQPVRDRAANCKPRAAANRMNRLAPGRPAGAGQRNAPRPGPPWCRARPATPRSTREAAVQLAQQLVLRRRPSLDPAMSVRRPGGQLHNRCRGSLTTSPRPAKQQLGDRLQIQRVGLDPAPGHHPPLLTHVRRVQLHHLPTRPHRRAASGR